MDFYLEGKVCVTPYNIYICIHSPHLIMMVFVDSCSPFSSTPSWTFPHALHGTITLCTAHSYSK